MYVRVSMCMDACERANVLILFFSLLAKCTGLAYLCIKLFVSEPYYYFT